MGGRWPPCSREGEGLVGEPESPSPGPVYPAALPGALGPGAAERRPRKDESLPSARTGGPRVESRGSSPPNSARAPAEGVRSAPGQLPGLASSLGGRGGPSWWKHSPLGCKTSKRAEPRVSGTESERFAPRGPSRGDYKATPRCPRGGRATAGCRLTGTSDWGVRRGVLLFVWGGGGVGSK